MFERIFAILHRLTASISSPWRHGQRRSITSVKADMQGRSSQSGPVSHSEPPPFARWVYELDDEVTEYISGQQRAQFLLQSERRTAAVKARQSARRLREALPLGEPSGAHS